MPQEFGPEQRMLFETTASRLFEDVAARGGVPVDDPLVADEEESVELLRALGLLRLDEAAQRLVAVDPTTIQASVVSPMGQQGVQLISESSLWARAFAALSQTYRRSPSAADGPITELRGEHIGHFIVDLVSGAQRELLTAQPQIGRDAAALREAANHEILALRRGVTIRTLYQHAARRGRITRQYVGRVTAEGAEVRTLDEFFNRLIVVDREVAIIPSGDERGLAFAVRDPAVVAYLADMFERYWDRARPFTDTESSTIASIAAEQRAMTIRMLIEGHSDAKCAKRMGVSPRTYAAYVADLKDEYEAQTRFQLGYRMGQQTAKETRKRPAAG